MNIKKQNELLITLSDEYSVSEELAFKHAAIAMCEHAVFELPSLVEDVDVDASWFDCILGEPLLLFDINQSPVMYVFPVMDWRRVTRGRIFVAYSKLLGSTVLSVQRHATDWNFKQAMYQAVSEAIERYQNWTISQVVPVLYDMPNVGVMAVVTNPRTGHREKIVVNINSGAPVPIVDSECLVISEIEMDNFFAWSRLDMGRSFDETPLLHQWNRENEWALDRWEQMSWNDKNREDLQGLQLCSWKEPSQIERIMKIDTECEVYVAPVRAHYLSPQPGYCTVAAARMIASRYNVFDSNEYIASVMGIPWPNPNGSSKWATANDELKYYKNRLNKKKSKVYSDYAFLSNPINYKKEITDKGKGPANLRKWSIQRFHHSRVLAGIRICQKSFGETVQLGLLSTTDWLSPNKMAHQWDKFDNTQLNSNGVVSINLSIGGLVTVRD